MEKPDLLDLVASTGTLATLPGTVVDLLYLLSDPATSAEDVRLIIERDPAMTANVLKLGNSAYYGVSREITSVRDALVMLGNRCVAALSFATGMAPVLRRELDGYGLTRQEFWQHSLVTGAAASEAMRHSGNEHLCCDAFTAGLVHDIGMLVIDPWLRQKGLTIPVSGESADINQEEMDLLGFDHCIAGSLLADRWGFPPKLLDTISQHHNLKLGNDCDPVVRAVAAGNHLAEILDSSEEPESWPDEDGYLKQLGFPADLLTRVQEDLTTDLEETLVRATSSSPVTLKN